MIARKRRRATTASARSAARTDAASDHGADLAGHAHDLRADDRGERVVGAKVPEPRRRRSPGPRLHLPRNRCSIRVRRGAPSRRATWWIPRRSNRSGPARRGRLGRSRTLRPRSKGERPSPVVLASPSDDRMKVALHVHDRRLPTAVGVVGVVRAVDDEQHDRSGAEVERDVVADVVAGVTGHRERKPSLLDGRHADAQLRTTPSDHRCIRQELARGHDRAEVVDVRDVEDLGAGRWRGRGTRSRVEVRCCDCCPVLRRAPASGHRAPILPRVPWRVSASVGDLASVAVPSGLLLRSRKHRGSISRKMPPKPWCIGRRRSRIRQ